jgi:hypothetical protein
VRRKQKTLPKQGLLKIFIDYSDDVTSTHEVVASSHVYRFGGSPVPTSEGTGVGDSHKQVVSLSIHELNGLGGINASRIELYEYPIPA